MSVTFVTLIDNDSFERGLKSTVKSRVKREHLYGNDWTLLGGEKGVEILHPCGKGEIDMLKKMEMGHPCGEREYNGEGYLLKIDFGKGVVRLDSLVGRLG